MGDQFGSRLFYAMFSVKGDVSEDIGIKMVEKIVDEIGMERAVGESISRYPVNGRGGVGYTFFQPITESFLAFDAWPDLKGAYLVICSCKPFSVAKVQETMLAFGLKVMDGRMDSLGIY